MPSPNLADYEAACRTFRWKDARAALDGLPGGRGLNIAQEAVDRHACGERRDHVALRWLPRAGEARDITYGDLQGLTNRRFLDTLDRLLQEPARL